MTQIRVSPKESNPTHELALGTKEEKWGVRLKGIQSIQEVGQTPSTIFKTGGGRKWGDYDPTYSHLQQDTWHGGRGQEDFSDDQSRFYSGNFLTSYVPGKLTHGMLWKWSDTDHRDYNMHIPGSVTFRQLIGSKLYFSSKFTVAAQDTTSYDAAETLILLRRRGNPGTLTVELWTDDGGGEPDAIISSCTDTTTTATVTDIVSKWLAFTATGTPTLAHGTIYHVVVYGASADNATNHWAVGVDTSGSASFYSTAGATWAAAGDTMYYRVVDADVACKWHLFMLDGTDLYSVNQPAAGNSATYFWDETNDEWDVTPAAAGDVISNIVYDVAVSKNIAHMARSTTEVIWTYYNNGGTRTGQDDATGGNKADRLLAFNDPVDGPQIWRAENDTWYMSRSDVKAFNTDLVFGDDIKLPEGFNILQLVSYNDQVWARTTDGLYSLKNDRPSKLDVGLGTVIEQTSYDAPLLAKDLFLYLGWSYSLERLYGGTLDDIGPWKGTGLPDGLQGSVSALAGGVGMVFAAVDGGSGNTSSVYALTEGGNIWHPIWEAWEAGQRVRNLFVQPQNGTTNPLRLWISVGADLVYIDFPDESLNPLKDSDQEFVWESVVETSSMDMGAASLPKLFKELSVVSKNLGTVANIGVDYQIDQDVGSTDDSDWIQATELYLSPRDNVPLNLGNREKIRLRLRMMTNTKTTPVEIQSTVLKGLARTPMKRQWNVRVRMGHLQRTRRGAQDHDPIEFYKWILKSAQSAEAVLMEANDELMHNVFVFIESPSLFRKFLNTIQKWISGDVTLTLREA